MFSSAGVLIGRCMEVFLSVDGALSSPGGADFTFEPQQMSDGPLGWGFQHRAGRCRPGELGFRTRVVGFVDI